MRVGRTFCLVILLTATLAFVGCEAEEEPYVSPSGQEVAPEEVVDTPSDAVTVNLLIDDELYGYALDNAFNWDARGGDYDSDLIGGYYTYNGVEYYITLQQYICDLGAMNGLGNITTFSTPNPAGECAVIKGHGYVFYCKLIPERTYIRNPPYNEEVSADVQQAVFNDYYNNTDVEYYCVWVKDVFENGITVQYVVRKTSDVTNS